MILIAMGGKKMDTYDSKTRVKQTVKKKPTTNFLVSIYYTENHSFQGVVQWLDTGKKVSFRSDYELMMLMNEATSMTNEISDTYRHWNDIKNIEAI